jgi:hypothetical protein
VNKLMSAQATQDLPRRLDATLRHLESLARRFDAQGGPMIKDVRDNLAEMNKALLAAQAALAKLDTAADRVAELARPDSRMVAGMTQASEDLARAASAVRSLTEQEAPTVQNVNAALKEIARAADALRLLAETLEQQPDAIWRGKKTEVSALIRNRPKQTNGGDSMKLLRYGPKGREKPGLIAPDGSLRDLSVHVAGIGWNELSAAGQKRLRALDPMSLPKLRGTPRLGVPFTGISKIVGIGLNYRAHANEAGMPIPTEPVMFMKATTCISGPNDPIVKPVDSTKLDWEVELGIVIGREARRVIPRPRAGPCRRLLHLQRRLRTQLPARTRRPVGQGQGLRQLRPDRPLAGDERRSTRPAGAAPLARPQWRTHAGFLHRRHGVFLRRDRQLCFALHDPAARRRDLHRHAARRRHGPRSLPRRSATGSGWRCRRPRRAAADRGRRG